MNAHGVVRRRITKDAVDGIGVVSDRKQAHSVEGLLGHLVELNLQVAKLVVVRGDVLTALHRILGAQPLELVHPVYDLSCRGQDSVLHLKERNRPLQVVLSPGQSTDRCV